MRYRTIVADPPWPMPKGGSGHWGLENGVTRLPYLAMTVPDIAALPVPELADESAHLYLWTFNAFIEDAYAVARAWGFTPSTLLTWCKTPRGIGLGGAFTLTTEQVLFARRGAPPALERIDSTWWNWKRGAHSAKPEAFLDVVERVSPPPRVELFARRNRLGWDTWGNESLEMVNL